MAALLLWTADRAAAQVVISEFMASNDDTLVDGDGNSSDWIELYNTSDSAVDLTGWYLSDTPTNLTQWAFPAEQIEAGAFLVVFASGQTNADYTDLLGYRHTTFKLSASGESVILTEPDGVTVADAFLDYPAQETDVSYGLEQDSSTAYLITEGEDTTAYVGTSSEPSASWKTPSFNDSEWTSGSTGVGYGSDYDSMIGLDLESKMVVTSSGRPPSTTYYNSAYIRVEFSVTDASGISQLALRMKYDDGFVAYINGTQVASENAPTSLSYSSSATASHSGSAYEDYTLLNAGDYLVSGVNVLAIQGLAYPTEDVQGPPGTTTTSTSDFFIMPVLSSVTAGQIYTNTSVYLNTATPGTDNVQGVLGYVGDTSFSVDRGFFSGTTNVEISCKTEGAEIYYTTDATEPSSENGTLYTGPISMSKTTVLRAVATKSGYQSSDIDTQTYFFLSDIIAQGTNVSGLEPYFPTNSINGQSFDYGMDTDITQSSSYSGEIEDALLAIPSISIVTDPDHLFSSASGIYVNPEEEGEAWERETSIELINPDGTDGFQINGGIRIRGASSAKTTNPKHSFRLFFRSEYGTSRLNYPLFGDQGTDSFKRMDLRTGQNFSWANQTPKYATWLYDIFTRDTHRDMNQPYTAGEYYHLYINGMYWGLYQTEERCESNYAESYYGDDNDDYDAVKADADSGDIYAVDGTRDAYDSLWAGAYGGVSANASYFALQGKNEDGTENSSYTKLLDVDNVIDYMLLVYFTANRDSPVGPPMNSPTMPRNLTAIYNRKNPDGFKFVAHDNEHSLERTEGVTQNRFSVSLSSSFDAVDRFNPWSLNLQLMDNAEYKLRFADHVHEYFFNGGLLTAEVCANRMEVRRDEIYSAVVAESARWGDSTGDLYTRDDDWLGTVDWLLSSYFRASPTTRSDTVLAQIVAKGWYPSVDAPEFSQHGGSFDSGDPLSISGSGTIYYTTDGTDPRAVGGAVSGTAYSSAITLDHTAQVKARCLSGEVWSALTRATFVLDEASPLRVTEIMYHPADTAAEAEFVELYNAGTETIGLAGTEFSMGIYFDFTDGDVATLDPGEYAVLVSDYDAFTNRYSNWASIKIAGEYHGKFFISAASLDNGGEELVLQDGLGQTILDFAYEDWYAATDGEGFSLTLIDPTAATNTWSDSAAWRASTYTGGTPGEAPYDFPAPGDLVINEALTHQDNDTPGDWIELYNSSTNTLDINGWFVSDEDDNLTMVELSGLDAIAPGGYLVLTEADHFGLEAAGTNGFALSELGETIYLSSGEEGVITGYRTGQSFGAAERDVTFGRQVKSDGSVDFTAQSVQTSGATNAYPLIGDVVFTEMMYHPADSNAYEYIEIYNRSSVEVALYDATYPTNTWKLDGAVEFSFPEGLTIASGECILITETNEAAFRTVYSVDDSITVLGPYEGKLNNDGENLKLTRPGDPEALTGEVPYILVERVEYNDAAPWPTDADGLGASLERTDTSLYPNDAASWTAGTEWSPGTLAGADSDRLPDSWEITYFGAIDADNGGEDDDWDGDGVTNYEEWYAGTDPTNAASVFAFTYIDAGSNAVFAWSSTTGKAYTLWMSTNLVSDAFRRVDEQIPATPPENMYTSALEEAESAYYLLEVSGE
jgi:hypothetical protein